MRACEGESECEVEGAFTCYIRYGVGREQGGEGEGEGQCTGEERCKHAMSCVQARSGTACKHAAHASGEAEACQAHARGSTDRSTRAATATTPSESRMLEARRGQRRRHGALDRRCDSLLVCVMCRAHNESRAPPTSCTREGEHEGTRAARRALQARCERAGCLGNSSLLRCEFWRQVFCVLFVPGVTRIFHARTFRQKKHGLLANMKRLYQRSF